MHGNKITLTRPDDWHVHVRDGAALATVVPQLARQFHRAIIMPNLMPPVTTTGQARDYRQRILAALPPGDDFQPLMTLYLTDNTPPTEVRNARDSGLVHGIKLYPAGATTNSDAGVTDISKVMDALETMAEVGMPLLVHGEVTRGDVDVFDREKVFIDSILSKLRQDLPELRIVFEHITTTEAVQFVLSCNSNTGATITPHHLLLNRNHMLAGGIRPHLYCLPILKQEQDREALIAAATSGDPRFFLGTDSAPHAQLRKESACGCAGIYSSHIAMELYAEAFDAAGALDKLEGFASFFGADFYQLPRNQGTMTLVREEQTVAESYPFSGEQLIPFRAGGRTDWRVE